MPSKPLKSALVTPPSSPPEHNRGRRKRAHFRDDSTEPDPVLRRTTTAPPELGEGVTSEVNTTGSAGLGPGQIESGTPCDEVDAKDAAGRRWKLVVKMMVDEVKRVEGARCDSAPDPLILEVEDDAEESTETEHDTHGFELEHDDQEDEDDVAEFPDDEPNNDDAATESESDETIASDSGEEYHDAASGDGDLTPTFEQDDFTESKPTLTVHTEIESEPSATAVNRHVRRSTDDGPVGLSVDQQADNDRYSVEFIMPIIGETKGLEGASSRPQLASQQRIAAPSLAGRRVSESGLSGHVVRGDGQPRRRASSMTDFQQLKERLKLHPFSVKATPADCAISACSVRVATPPRLNTVYEHSGGCYLPFSQRESAIRTAQTVTSASSMYRMVWEEPAWESPESDTAVIEQPFRIDAADDPNALQAHVQMPSPIGKAKAKLAAWSWARERGHDEHDDSRLISLLSLDIDARRHALESSPSGEHPLAPPNTATSSARHSGPHTPHDLEADDRVEEEETNEEVEDDSPVELRFRSDFHRIRSMSAPAMQDYLTAPTVPRTNLPTLHLPDSPERFGGLPRHLSNLAEMDEHFRSHRDSLDVYHQRMRGEERVNQLLANSKDSFVLAKSKYEAKYPGSTSAAKGHIQWSRYGGLSPIMDASPPDARKVAAEKGLSRLDEASRRLKKDVAKDKEDDAQKEDEGQQKWYKAVYRRDEDGMLVLKLLGEEASP
ncbi:hypothetical protein BAUCODRAFT_125570 [Baudoinia panamericana UAMH 10762]|uniref:Uncharacterized protein n=1 Tax=Baudoinia panamericana (strain UAMH 10762) TaxID=717646 RepID=M2N102_BAUPA|nr:uncharacterized protein BAUCODRAFT_125570 [Baudoinia panamericana UAMH 10762]EMC92584.1 hypothetical protein BAUCODRAFT_125570 [Baudoinia panamericana UAMH 10762]